MAVQLEAENLWMMERETQSNGASGENHVTVFSGSRESTVHHVHDHPSYPGAVISCLGCDSSLHTGLDALLSCTPII